MWPWTIPSSVKWTMFLKGLQEITCLTLLPLKIFEDVVMETVGQIFKAGLNFTYSAPLSL